MQKKRRAITCAVADNISPPEGLPQDPWALGPDDLRNQVQRALSTFCETDRRALCQRLLTELAKAGVPIGSSLFLLGIPAAGLDDLTPSDVGKLLRYVLINSPSAIKALSGPLAELLVVREVPAPTPQGIDKAA